MHIIPRDRHFAQVRHHGCNAASTRYRRRQSITVCLHQELAKCQLATPTSMSSADDQQRAAALAMHVKEFVVWIESDNSPLAPENVNLLHGFESISEKAEWFLDLHRWVQVFKRFHA